MGNRSPQAKTLRGRVRLASGEMRGCIPNACKRLQEPGFPVLQTVRRSGRNQVEAIAWILDPRSGRRGVPVFLNLVHYFRGLHGRHRVRHGRHA